MQWIVNRQKALGTDETDCPVIAITSSPHLLIDAKTKFSKLEGEQSFIYIPKSLTYDKIKLLVDVAKAKRQARRDAKVAGTSTGTHQDSTENQEYAEGELNSLFM